MISWCVCVCVCVCFQTEYARMEGGKCVYRIHRSPMCEYMINFIHKLKHLPEKYMMNSVLENFTILQVSCLTCICSTLTPSVVKMLEIYHDLYQDMTY